MAHKRKETLWPTNEKKHYGLQTKRNTMANKRKETLAHKRKETLGPTNEKKDFGSHANRNTMAQKRKETLISKHAKNERQISVYT